MDGWMGAWMGGWQDQIGRWKDHVDDYYGWMGPYVDDDVLMNGSMNRWVDE